jgi:hypothetical protein
LIIDNTKEGLAAARARGRTGGRKPKLTAHQVQLAQQLYDAGEKTFAEIAAIFTVPRTTIYGHLTNGSAGARPRARKRPASTGAAPATAVGPSAIQAGTAAQLRDDLRPAPARIAPPDQPLSAPLSPRTQATQPTGPPTRDHAHLPLPNLRKRAVDAQTRWQQRQDLAIIWLHLDSDTIREQRHCVACQPHDQPLIIECDRCGDGPLITGLPTNTPIGQCGPQR